jgi:uncharacterized protein (DUF433 family)
MNKVYVEKRDGGHWIAGTRISLDSIVYAFRRGASPEGIQRSFPLLSLEQIYGAITFYLGNQAEVDASLKEGEAAFEQIRQDALEANSELHHKLEEARRRLPLTER